MKKTLLASLGLATSLLAITQEQQIELDKIFESQKAKIEQDQSLSEDKRASMLKILEGKKKEIEGKSDEEISAYLNEEKRGSEKYEREAIHNGVGWAFGALGARYTTFFGGKLGKTHMGYASFGPQYNFTENNATLLPKKGFSLSLPIGLGEIKANDSRSDANFVLPIAIEAKYLFSDFGFGVNAGLRYSYSPQNIGNLHIMDFYAGIDIYYGIYLEAGYVFYSSQDITLGNRTYSTDPLSGAFTLNFGWRF